MKNKKINQKKPTVTIDIPAFNEDVNIESLLVSLLNQKRNKFILKDIIVYSDASTDKTHEKVTALTKEYPIIKLIIGTERKGKYFRVNQAFRNCKSDILVILDADITLVGESFLDKLINKIVTDPKAQMAAAHQITLRPDSFIGKVIYTNFVLWDYVRWSIPNYLSPSNYYGAATAYKGSFARSVHIPASLSDPHLYIYLMADKLNGFRYCRDAETLEWPITTLNDFNKFIHRSIGKKDKELEKIFGTGLEKIYFIPWKYKLIGLMKSFKYEPFYTPFALMLSLYMKIVLLLKTKNSPVWDIVTSTKKHV